MHQFKEMLACDNVKGVVRTSTGEVIVFHNPGVKDLFNLVATHPHVLEKAYVADRVIGRGAALLLVLGKVERVFAQLISQKAFQVLQDAEIRVDFDEMVPNIINRDGTDICPVEKLTMNVNQPDVALEIIRVFLTSNKII